MPRTVIHDDINVTRLTATLKEERQKGLAYAIDGLVIAADVVYNLVSTGNPLHAFAFKVSRSGNAITRVLNVEWRVSRAGRLIPRIRVEPVTIGDEVIQWTSGYNARFIWDKCLGPDAKVSISLQGDAIPVLMDVVEPAPAPQFPENWRWDDNRVHILALTTENPAVVVKKITHFIKTIGIQGFDDKKVSSIVTEFDLRSVLDLLQLTGEEFGKVSGFTQERGQILMAQIRAKLYDGHLTPDILLVASGVMGIGAGIVKARKIVKIFPDIWYNPPAPQEILRNLTGFTLESAKSMIDSISEFVREVRPNLGVFREGKREVVLTGFRSRELTDALTKHGIEVVDTLKKTTWVLVVPEENHKSQKVDKAEKLGVRVVVVDQLKAELNTLLSNEV